MGGVQAAHSGTEALSGNIAGIETVTDRTIIAATYIPFGILPLSQSFASIAAPLKTGVAGFQLNTYGNSLYRHFYGKLAFAHHLNFISLGASAGVSQITISERRTQYLPVFQFGGQAFVSQELIFGAYISNLTLNHLKGQGAEGIMAVGLCWKPFEKFQVNFDYQKYFSLLPVLKGGIQYKINDFLICRTGFSSKPTRLHAGFTLTKNRFQVSYATVTHPSLGLSHSLSVTLSGK
jgi:hypothetical protein